MSPQEEDSEREFLNLGLVQKKGAAHELPPTERNHVWAYDFVFDTCANGQQLKCLTGVEHVDGEHLLEQLGTGHAVASLRFGLFPPGLAPRRAFRGRQWTIWAPALGGGTTRLRTLSFNSWEKPGRPEGEGEGDRTTSVGSTAAGASGQEVSEPPP